ncbi:Preprotein translocase subunit SecG [Candidatus Rhodobacter oscarellae]|uniref:Protein-export membrane protein SecG n=1 Tax=Candidatus Rhodobacter oscarellae TaxID=1675527 RepID=A0A0J9EGE6_9RHOB|nr:preprotein translocase subunit SecG [Candidatus Rhodobacter lobularis]KMW60739.1 Preprotein translocase subunit SecG [Candidatus Rhodobacter lobularis]
MENVILIILLILALALIGIVLLQRSEGGGLGMGGGGGGGGVVSGRSAATALGRITWYLGGAFMAMCIVMTVLNARNTADSSVVDRLGTDVPAAEETIPGLPAGGSLLPPTADDGASTPRAD